MSLTRLVAITGCDSGLGYALAARSAREGLVTVAGMLNGVDTNAATSLAKLTVHPCPLDVTSVESVVAFQEFVNGLLKDNPNYRLHAIVNNAGIMTIGDFEWHTHEMIQNTINVNLLGAMRVTSAFLPQLRKSAAENGPRPRIINVASHCGQHPLPGFAPYSASKAGVLAWTQALRLELRSYGLSAVAYVPGGFVGSSNILSAQTRQSTNMLENLDPDQRAVYEKRILTLNRYLGHATQESPYDALNDVSIIDAFVKSLTDNDPKALYKVQSWRYAFYYNLMKLPLPEALHHWLVKKFLMFPEAN